MNSDLSLAVQRKFKISPLLPRSRLAAEQPLLRHATSGDAQIKQWESEHPESAWAEPPGRAQQIWHGCSVSAGKLSAVTSAPSPGTIARRNAWPLCKSLP